MPSASLTVDDYRDPDGSGHGNSKLAQRLFGLGFHVARGFRDHFLDERTRTIVIADGEKLFCQRQFGLQWILPFRQGSGDRDGFFSHVECQ